MNDRKKGRHDQLPSKKKRPAPRKQKLPSYLPPALQTDGSVAAALKSSKSIAEKDESLLHVWKLLRAELKRLRLHKKWLPQEHNQGADDVKRIFRRILMDESSGNDNDPARLLRTLLAQWEGFTPSEELHKRTWDEYVNRRKEYDRLLGDFIPAWLRNGVAEMFYEANNNQTALDDWPVFLSRLEVIRERPMLGLGTRLTTLDEYTAGVQGVAVLAGETGAGKSALALQLGVGVLRPNPTAAVLLYTLELPKTTYYARLYSHFSGLPYRTMTRPTSSQDRQCLETAGERLQKEILPRLRIMEWISRQNYERLTLKVIQRNVQEMWKLPGVERVLIIVDPLQRWEMINPAALADEGTDGPPPRPLTDLEADDLRMRTLMQLQAWTRRPDVPDGEPVLAVSGVRKMEHSRKGLELTDVRGSYNTVCEAHCVLLLEPQSEAVTDGQGVVPVVLSVKKVRDGGAQGDIHLDFHHTLSKFEESRKDVRGKAHTSTQGQQEGPRKRKRFSGK